jgi:hypothetical protein
MSETKEDRRTSFFIDGFNLYHSVRAAEKLLPNRQLKWLNIPSMCKSTSKWLAVGLNWKKFVSIPPEWKANASSAPAFKI